ncbi:FtsW/RodA/SpoVE family cell cycle protein [Nocardiopsis gilva YIM 90087]|uniref:FtsW/RodA/SpoVE family cell cycle protein n=1 Tax=Nocardiopsis gilva YIM 90087 TaxID=1235441 RepID=A0A223S2Y4_9ACTN|nr:FtsW/RodA/SpoVE family cell cycle protein [Nocardiopsis gilva]ASU82480.1 FtsW/RodA/SpoVE family cell cycle protein [Nocardiopsis gilva YIM 90087]
MTPEPIDTGIRPRRRNVEFALLLLAVVILAGGLCLAGLEIDGRVPDDLALFVGGFGGAVLALHIALRRLAPWADPLILPLAAALNGLGLTVIWGLHRIGGPTQSEAGKQLMWSVLGIVGCLVVLLAIREPRRLQRYPYLMAVAGLVLLALPMIPVIGIDAYGAHRWIGMRGFTVQPSEFAKLLLVVFLAAYLGMKRDVLSTAARQLRVRGVKVFSLPRMRDLGPMTVAWGFAILLLVGTKDLGASLLLFSVFLAILYTATGRKSWVGIGLLMFSAGATVAWAMFVHVRQRVVIWLNPFEPHVYHADGGSYQLVQGMFALADGGLFGTGFSGGRAAEIFAADSDFILVSIGEKLGLTGLMAVVILLLLLAERGFRIALASREIFVKLMATGFAFLLAFQVFVVLGGVTQIIPLTGMTTPFLAAGGSSLVSSWIMIGLWLRLSDSARRPPPTGKAHAQLEDATEVIQLPVHAATRSDDEAEGDQAEGEQGDAGSADGADVTPPAAPHPNTRATAQG